MIRHQVYFDTLGSMKEDTPSWRSVFAGLSVLRLVDSCEAQGSVKAVGWAPLHSVRAAIEEMSDGDVIRGVLSGIVEALTAGDGIDDSVCTSLLAYGRALDYEASWGLATDVFSTVARIVRPERNARLAVEAQVAVGGAARRNGDWEVSARAYSQAAYIADTLGDRAGVLTVQVGIANTYLAKGNLPQAQSILDDVITQARDQNLPEVQGIALHSRSSLAQRRGDPVEAVRLAYEALNTTRNPVARDAVLEDLAGAFSEAGMNDAARDAHLLLANTAQLTWVRWQATINLMELASIDGQEEVFEQYASQLRQVPLGPWLQSHFLLFFGEGLQRFGRFDAAEEVLGEAVAYTNANEIHSVSFKAEEVLARVRLKNNHATRHHITSVPEDLLAAAHAISELRKAALSLV